MTYHWRSDPGDPGADTPRFDDQSAAEAWLTEHYEELVDRGALTVTLVDGDRVVYGPMGLLPE